MRSTPGGSRPGDQRAPVRNNRKRFTTTGPSEDGWTEERWRWSPSGVGGTGNETPGLRATPKIPGGPFALGFRFGNSEVRVDDLLGPSVSDDVGYRVGTSEFPFFPWMCSLRQLASV